MLVKEIELKIMNSNIIEKFKTLLNQLASIYKHIEINMKANWKNRVRNEAYCRDRKQRQQVPHELFILLCGKIL